MFRLSRAVACVAVAILPAAGHGYSRLQAAAQPPPPAQGLAAAPSEASPRTLLNEYCVTCHNQKLKTAGLMLDAADVQHVGAGAELWESVVKKIRSGAMPPPGRRRPDPKPLDAFVTGLEAALDREAAAHPNPGRPADHRLNPAEYTNAIRDLLALDIDARVAPAGGRVGPRLRQHRRRPVDLAHARSSATCWRRRRSAGSPSAIRRSGATIETFTIPRGLGRTTAWTRTCRSGRAAAHSFATISRSTASTGEDPSADATSQAADSRHCDARADRRAAGRGAGHALPIGGECLRLTGAEVPKTSFGYQTAPRYERTADDALAGPVPGEGGHARPGRRLREEERGDRRAGARRCCRPRHSSSTYERRGWTSTASGSKGRSTPPGPATRASRRQIFVCRPAADARPTKKPCAQEDSAARSRAAPIAGRSPMRDVETLLRFYRDGRQRRGLRAGHSGRARTAPGVAAVPVPHRARSGAAAPPGGVYRISDFELASRLSFFLWSSIPDDELLDVAARGAAEGSDGRSSSRSGACWPIRARRRS